MACWIQPAAVSVGCPCSHQLWVSPEHAPSSPSACRPFKAGSNLQVQEESSRKIRWLSSCALCGSKPPQRSTACNAGHHTILRISWPHSRSPGCRSAPLAASRRGAPPVRAGAAARPRRPAPAPGPPRPPAAAAAPPCSPPAAPSAASGTPPTPPPAPGRPAQGLGGQL